MKSRLKTVLLRRKREGKTDYRKRLRLLQTKRARLVVRPALKNTTIQIIQYNPSGDKIVAGLTSKKLSSLGWNVHGGNLPAAYLTGYLVGKKALSKGVKEAVLDTGLKTPVKGGRIYAAVKGIIDSGVVVPVGDNVLPAESRLKGEHIKPEVVQLFEKTKKAIEEQK